MQVSLKMGKTKDLSPRKVGQIKVLLKETCMKQKEIARKLKISPQSVSLIKKKEENHRDLGPKRKGNCGRKRKTSPRVDRKIVKLALGNRRLSCRKIATLLAEEETNLHPRTVNNRLLEAGLRAYRPRKKPRLTQAMIRSRYEWAKQHAQWSSDDWKKVCKHSHYSKL